MSDQPDDTPDVNDPVAEAEFLAGLDAWLADDRAHVEAMTPDRLTCGWPGVKSVVGSPTNYNVPV